MFPKNKQNQDLGEPIDECALDRCQQPIYPGWQVWKHGCDVYCSLQHLAEGIGAQKIGVENK